MHLLRTYWHWTVSWATVLPSASRIAPVTMLSTMKLRPIFVAPWRTSLRLLSKSNSASSPIAFWAGLVFWWSPEVSYARYLPAARLLPSTEALERSALASQRTRTVWACATVVMHRAASAAEVVRIFSATED